MTARGLGLLLGLVLPGMALAVPCGTSAKLPFGAPRAKLKAPAGVPAGTCAPIETGDGLNQYLSQHFVVRYGDRALVTPERVKSVSDALELSWTRYVDELQHPAPWLGAGICFDVYIGESGPGSLSTEGAAGYFWRGEDGVPYLVIAAANFADEMQAELTAAHELYHAVQDVTERYPYEGVSAWYWEATAEWAAIEVYPDDPTQGSFAFAVGLRPDLPMDSFDYPDSGTLTEVHQYGAFIYPFDMTTRVATADLVRDSWVEPGDGDPIEVLRAGLAAQGEDFDQVFVDGAARIASWDFEPWGPRWAAETLEYEEYYASSRPRVAMLSGAGSALLEAVPEKDAPGRYGFGVIEINAPEGELLVGEVVLAEAGTKGSPLLAGARLVVQRESGLEYLTLPIVDGRGVRTVYAEGVTRAWLVVATWSDERKKDERFPFSWRLGAAALPEIPTLPSGSGGKGCGCDAGGRGALGWLMLAPLLLLRRRRA